MTPDEVVKILENMLTEIACKQAPKIERLETPIYDVDFKLQALQSAISILQDYQKLRERVSVEKIDSLIRNYAFRHECNLGNEGIILEKNICEIAQAIVTYLQQPTEPEVRG